VNVSDELELDFGLQEPAARRRGSKGEQTRAVIVEAALRGVLRALIDVQAPYHSFAAKLYKHAAEPASPLSPFSTASSPTRSAAIALYAEVIEGSRIRIPAGLRSRLPELLWLYSLGIVLYWVHDTSPGCEKTYRLIDLTTPLAERLIRLARLPVLRSMTPPPARRPRRGPRLADRRLRGPRPRSYSASRATGLSSAPLLPPVTDPVPDKTTSTPH
jgi:hypothetical protein